MNTRLTAIFNHATATLWCPAALFALAVSYNNFFLENSPVLGIIWLALAVAFGEGVRRYVADELFFDAEEAAESEEVVAA